MGDTISIPARRWLRNTALSLVMAVTVSTMVVVAPAPAAAVDGVSCNIVTGAETPSQQVARLYKAVFDRPPEPEGWNYWKGAVTATSLFYIAGFFVQAPEFVNRYGLATNDEFVGLVYQNVMGREPEPEGFDYWLGVLDGAELTRADMVVYFAESTEFKRLENNVYFETCAAVAAADASVVSSKAIELSGSQPGNPGFDQILQIEEVATRNAVGDSTTYGYHAIFGGGASALGQRKPGESCVTWWESAGQAPVQQAMWGAGINFERLAAESGDPESPSPSALANPAALAARVVDFAARVDGAPGLMADGCTPDDALLMALAGARFELLPEVAADQVDTSNGYVRRRFELGTEQIRAALAMDGSLLTVIDSLVERLEGVDLSNAALRAAGHDELANDRVEFSIVTWEDATGNLVFADITHRIYLTENNLSVRLWVEESVIHRIPGQ